MNNQMTTTNDDSGNTDIDIESMLNNAEYGTVWYINGYELTYYDKECRDNIDFHYFEDGDIHGVVVIDKDYKRDILCEPSFDLQDGMETECKLESIETIKNITNDR